MEQVNFYLKTKLRLISQWAMAVLFSLLAHNAFASTEVVVGSWNSSGGQSIYNMSNPRYSFTLEFKAEVEIKLSSTNCKADSYLYLLDSDGKQLDYNDDGVGDPHQRGLNSYCEAESLITQTLYPGEYQLVAATYNSGESGDFVLRVSGLGVSNLDSVDPGQLKGIKQPLLKVIDTWQGSAGQQLAYEKNPSYTFRVFKTGKIDIRLENQTNDCQADPYLYLLDKNGNQIDYNDDWSYDPEDRNMTSYCTTNSRITRELSAGEYQLMAATYWPDQSGSFVLSLKGDKGALSPLSKIRAGYWGASGGQDHQSAGNPRFDFRLLEPGLVSIDLMSLEVDTYLYLLDSDQNLHKNDDGGYHTNSRLEVFLPAGTHSLVAATYYKQQQGHFKLSATLEGQQGGFYWLKDGSALDSTQVTFIETNNKPQPIEIQADPSYSAFIKGYIVSDQPQANNMGWKEIDNWWWHLSDNKIGYVRSMVTHNFLATSQDKTIYLHLKDSDGHIKSYPLELIYQNRLPISGLSINNHASYTNNPQVNLQFEVTGTSSVTSYLIEEIGSNGQVMKRSGWTGTGYSEAAGTHSISYRLASGDGLRTLRLKLRDKDGYESRSVDSATILLDTQRPAISLKGNATESIMQGQAYTDAGATASDNIDGNISANIQVVNTVNINQLGTYTVTYNVVDKAGNSAPQVTRTVIVKPLDTTPPVITLLGYPKVIIDLHQPYMDAGATATDNIDGDISANIQVDNRVNINLVGEYKVIYKVTDTAGNSAQLTRTVKVEWTEKPIDTLSGAGVIKLDWLHLQAIMDSKNYDLATIYYSTQPFRGLALDNYGANITGGGSKSFRPSDKLTSWTISGLKADTKYYAVMVLHSGSGLELLAREDALVKPPRLNDTGIAWGNNYPGGVNDGCSGETIEQQDCFHGRDKLAQRGALKKIGGGVAGFDFTRLNQDGSEYTGNGNYNDNPWACVRDNVTGLVWEVKTTDGGIHDKDNTYHWGGKTAMITQAARTKWSEVIFNDWDQLLDNSNNTMLCGIADWRVPTIIELFNIANKGANEPAIDTDYFPNTPGLEFSRYWSSNARLNNLRALSIDFYDGGIINTRQRETPGFPYRKYRVRLVANTQSTIKYTEESQEGMLTETPDSRYKSHSNGTVTDKQTGLMWQRCSLGQTWDGTTCTGDIGFYNWQDALAKAQGDNSANYTDWRLPNTNELVSLVAFDRKQPAINLTLFPNSPDRHLFKKRKDGKTERYLYSYWSATTAKAFYYHQTARVDGGAWVTDSGNGSTRREYFKLSQAIIDATNPSGSARHLYERVYNVRLVRSPRSGE